MNDSSVRVRFVNADPGHRASDAFLTCLTREASGKSITLVSDPRQSCDIEFASVQRSSLEKLKDYGGRAFQQAFPRWRRRDTRWAWHNPEPSGRARAHIWFTGENVRPPVGAWAGYLSFDLDPLDGRNAYCPLWWWSVGVAGVARSPFLSPAPSIGDLMQPRDPGGHRPGFVAAFINNPHPMRMHAIEALRKVGTVDVYGQAVGRPVESKYSIAKDYRFVLCFENDFYPGYVTEKPIEAWACGAVPIWWGSDPAGYLNEAAMINAARFTCLTDMAEQVFRVSRDDGAWGRIASQALVRREPDLQPVTSLIKRALES